MLTSCTHARIQRASALVLMLLLFLCSCLTTRAQDSGPSFRVTDCHIGIYGHGGLDTTGSVTTIHFENMSNEALTSITWRITTEAGDIDIVDVGNFQPHVPINHNFYRRRTSADLTRFSLEVDDPRSCTAIRTVAKSGQIWNDPTAAPATFYVPPAPTNTLVTTPATFDNPAHNPIGIVSCEFTIIPRFLTKPPQAYGRVRFRNLSPQTITHVTFRAFFGSAGMDFQKDGTFSTNALINTGDMTRYDLPVNVYKSYLDLDSPLSCTTVRATYSNGSTWLNPSVGPTEPPFPEPISY
jgi:hypothetical protein